MKSEDALLEESLHFLAVEFVDDMTLDFLFGRKLSADFEGSGQQ